MNSNALDLSPDEMRTLGHSVVDLLVEHFADLREKPATRHIDRAEIREHLSEDLPEAAAPLEVILRQLQERVFANIGLTTHPRFFAFVPSPSNFVSVMADCLAAGYNVFAGNWLEAAGPSEIERIVLEWLRRLVGLPESYGGLLVSGGSAANLTALAAARHVKLIESQLEVRHFSAARADESTSSPGTDVPYYEHSWGQRIAAGVAYCSTQTHSSPGTARQVALRRPVPLEGGRTAPPRCRRPRRRTASVLRRRQRRHHEHRRGRSLE
jgi:glutamate/tyrosine decarboxylase-like PLP-dependent enzyme